MTISELYNYAKEKGIENKHINLVGLAECGYSAVGGTRFYLLDEEHVVNLIVTEEDDDGNVDAVPDCYEGAISMWKQ